ncbi:MAG: hypothetical protein ACF8XB_20895 [Planctomycetota bacterium JB042]
MSQTTAASSSTAAAPRSSASFVERLNAEWHKPALIGFTIIVLAHWAEHLAQAFQIYVLNWPVPEARGVLGLWYPWMVQSELLHYAYALVMLVGLWIFRSGFAGRAWNWWMAAFWIQFWHHIEHALLQGQAILGKNLFDSPVPMSLVQVWVPRVELHLFYNTVVFLPMVVAMYHHMFPSPEDAAQHKCACALHVKS